MPVGEHLARRGSSVGAAWCDVGIDETVEAAWLLFVIALPYLGVFVYIVARGAGMTQRDLERMRASEAANNLAILDSDAADAVIGGPDDAIDGCVWRVIRSALDGRVRRRRGCNPLVLR